MPRAGAGVHLDEEAFHETQVSGCGGERPGMRSIWFGIGIRAGERVRGWVSGWVGGGRWVVGF